MAAEDAVVVADAAVVTEALAVVAADVSSSSSPHDTSRTPVTVQATAHRTARDDLRLRTIGLPPCLVVQLLSPMVAVLARAGAATRPQYPTPSFGNQLGRPRVVGAGWEYLVIIQRGAATVVTQNA